MNMSKKSLPTHSIYEIHEPVRTRIHVRIVDLPRVTGEDDLCALAHARDDGLDLEWR
jgi:hypothetical protein